MRFSLPPFVLAWLFVAGIVSSTVPHNLLTTRQYPKSTKFITDLREAVKALEEIDSGFKNNLKSYPSNIKNLKDFRDPLKRITIAASKGFDELTDNAVKLECMREAFNFRLCRLETLIAVEELRNLLLQAFGTLEKIRRPLMKEYEQVLNQTIQDLELAKEDFSNAINGHPLIGRPSISEKRSQFGNFSIWLLETSRSLVKSNLLNFVKNDLPREFLKQVYGIVGVSDPEVKLSMQNAKTKSQELLALISYAIIELKNCKELLPTSMDFVGYPSDPERFKLLVSQEADPEILSNVRDTFYSWFYDINYLAYENLDIFKVGPLPSFYPKC